MGVKKPILRSRAVSFGPTETISYFETEEKPSHDEIGISRLTTPPPPLYAPVTYLSREKLQELQRQEAFCISLGRRGRGRHRPGRGHCRLWDLLGHRKAAGTRQKCN